MCYGDTSNSPQDRIEFLSALGIDYRRLICAKQVHGDSVRYVLEKDSGSGALAYDSAIADTDAFVTDKLNLPLAIFTADCLPVFMYDPETPAIGLAHAGWRSTKADILKKTVRLMREKFDTLPENLIVSFGPSIRKCCYEVGVEFCDFFASGISLEAGKYYLDLAGINRAKLIEAGVRDEFIRDKGICTCCGLDRFFSFRKEGKDCGRMMSVMMLRSQK